MNIKVEKDTKFNARLMQMITTYYVWIDHSIAYSSDDKKDAMDRVNQIKKSYVETPQIEVIYEETI
jgi:hypothetical protein